MSAIDSNPFAAPPPQAMAPPAVQVAYNDADNDILMDYEDDYPAAQSAPGSTPSMVAVNGSDMDMDMDTNLVDSSTGGELVIPEKIHVRGVDNMNTAAVESWALEHFTEERAERVEWIDDTSCNLVYSTPAVASRALEALQLPQQATVALLTVRPAKCPFKDPNARLEIRIAKPTDRKERGARERSRYYLFHPEEDRGERFERGRRPRGRSDDGDYSRRYYDPQEHSRRVNNDYSENFYDDDAAARSSRPTRRRRTCSRSRSAPRRRSRERSLSPGRRRTRRRSRSPVELFPGRAADRAASSLNGDVKARNTGVELFPNKLRFVDKPIELFPDRAQAKQASFQETNDIWDKLHYPSPPGAVPQEKDLFPEKAKSKPKPKSLGERITMPAKSLEERITFGGNGSSGGGLSIRGRASAGMDDIHDDLFAEKLRSSKGTELFHSDDLLDNGYSGGGGGGGRRRRGRRSKAEDFLG